MNNKDLLKAIQNADRSFFEKAEARMHHREEHTMKNIIMRRIMTGAAAAAMLAVCVTGGIYLANRGGNGLTEPSANTPVTAPIEVQSTDIATAVTELPVTTALTAEPGPVNCFGGHGSFRYSPHSGLMCDDDYWYMNTLDCAPRSAAKYLPLERIAGSSPVVNALGMYLIDSQSPILYHVMTHKPDKAVYVVSEDGTETRLAFENLAACFRKSSGYQNPGACPLTISHLKDGKYYVFGTLFDADDPDNTEKQRPFWEIYDTETLTGSGEIRCPGERVFYDGDSGVYAIYDSWNDRDWKLGQELVRRFLHLRADGTAETVFEQVYSGDLLENPSANIVDSTLNSWFVYNNCIYYTDFESADYCKYDMNTKKTTTLRESEPNNEEYYFVNGTVYFVSNQDNKLFYGDPDLQDLHSWDIQLLDKDPGSAARHIDAVIDNTVVIAKYIGSNGTETVSSSLSDYMVLYHTDTGAVQYLYDPKYFTLPETASETTAPAAVTDTVTAETTAAAEQTTARRSSTNFLGGSGAVIASPHCNALADDEFWYERMDSRAKKSEAKYLPRDNSEQSKEFVTADDYYMTDEFCNDVYHVYCSAAKGIYLVGEDGTETPLMSGLYESFRRPDHPEHISVSVHSIMKLQDGKYYVDGSFRDADNLHIRADDFNVSFWMIYDTKTQTGKGQLLTDDDEDFRKTYGTEKIVFHQCEYAFPDGGTGAYIDCPDMHGIHHIAHCFADGTVEIALDQAMQLDGWFVHNDCIYYLSADGTNSFCQYDLKTGQTTVLMINSGWTSMFYANGRLYAVKGSILVYGNPELTNMHEWKIEYPENMDVFAEVCRIEAVCGDTVILSNDDGGYSSSSLSGEAFVQMLERHDYKILYHTDTEQVQFIYNADAYAPPAE